MKRFLILILFSLLIPIQNSSAAPSLEETIEFIVNGDGYKNRSWSIKDCKLTVKSDLHPGNDIIYLNRVNLKEPAEIRRKSSTGKEFGLVLYGKNVTEFSTGTLYGKWLIGNGADSSRTFKALKHLYSNFCEGAKSAF